MYLAVHRFDSKCDRRLAKTACVVALNFERLADLDPLVMHNRLQYFHFLFGVGGVLRELRMSLRYVIVPEDFAEASVPEIRPRGHQWGYRPKPSIV